MEGGGLNSGEAGERDREPKRDTHGHQEAGMATDKVLTYRGKLPTVPVKDPTW